MSKPATQLTVVTKAKAQTLTPGQQRAADAADCIARFHLFHEAVKGNVMAMKLAKFFAGIEVTTLCDLHHEEHGETRGGDQRSEEAQTKTDTPLSTLKLSDFLEDALGVTDRTARRYREHFQSCTEAHPEAAAKLRKWWQGWKNEALQLAPAAAPKGKGKGKGKAKQLVTTGAQSLALHEVCNLAAKEMQAILEQPDAWGLHELFEKPIKDVTPEEEEPPTGGDDDAKERLAKFWLKDVSRRLMNNELLKLRKQDREALLTTLEEATTKLKDSLQGKK